MVIGVLIERNGVHGVQVAENISTASAVMPSCEVGEVFGAGGLITDRRFRIGLQVRTISGVPEYVRSIILRG